MSWCSYQRVWVTDARPILECTPSNLGDSRVNPSRRRSGSTPDSRSTPSYSTRVISTSGVGKMAISVACLPDRFTNPCFTPAGARTV